MRKCPVTSSIDRHLADVDRLERIGEAIDAKAEELAENHPTLSRSALRQLALEHLQAGADADAAARSEYLTEE